MACGDICRCEITGSDTMTVTGTGSSGDPYVFGSCGPVRECLDPVLDPQTLQDVGNEIGAKLRPEPPDNGLSFSPNDEGLFVPSGGGLSCEQMKATCFPTMFSSGLVYTAGTPGSATMPPSTSVEANRRNMIQVGSDGSLWAPMIETWYPIPAANLVFATAGTPTPQARIERDGEIRFRGQLLLNHNGTTTSYSMFTRNGLFSWTRGTEESPYSMFFPTPNPQGSPAGFVMNTAASDGACLVVSSSFGAAGSKAFYLDQIRYW